MTCTRCDGSGFLNLHQVPQEIVDSVDAIKEWMLSHESDVSVCDCCGDGETWYGIPGEHYTEDDPPGPNGPYSYNGGLCECH